MKFNILLASSKLWSGKVKQIVEESANGVTYHYKIIGGRKLLHNLNGPARIVDGEKCYEGRAEWWVDGKRHRDNAPAVEWSDGDYDYFHRGKRHRLNGPAISRLGNNLQRDFPNQPPKDYLCMYVNGKPYSNEPEFNDAVVHWLSYKDVTREEIQQLIGKFKIVEW